MGTPEHVEGIMVTMKLPHEVHAAIKRLGIRMIETGTRPSKATIGCVVSEAIQRMVKTELPEGAKFCTTCGLVLPNHAPGCMFGVLKSWEKGGANG